MQVTIRANTAQEEFDYLKYILRKLDFYEKNNYKISLPNFPELNNHIEQKDEERLYVLFRDKEYDISFYDKGLSYLNTKKDQIESCLSILFQLKKFWDFKTFDKYEVLLTKYGPGGSYNYETGKITMLTDTEGKFKRGIPEHTVIHEIVHMGVQESIVDSFGLSHWEKESLVDLIAKIYLEECLGNYAMQNIKDNNLNTYITDKKSIEDLPNTLSSYKSQ